MCISYLFTFFVRPGGMRVMTMDGEFDDCLFFFVLSVSNVTVNIQQMAVGL